MKMKSEKTVSLSTLRKKLYSAIAMLLVASIMMVSSSYAWLVLSTAPEVSGINTQIGANGSLEIALLNTESYNDISRVTNADIDESDADFGLVPSAAQSNLSWGNLISLGDRSYGLNKITLNPGRLNISTANEDGDMFQIGQNLIKAPIYNADGRIIGLNVDDVITSTYNQDIEGFPISGQLDYGVRAVGTTAALGVGQQGINSARSTLTANRNEATKKARSTLKTSGTALGNVAMGIATQGDSATFSLSDVKALLALSQGLAESLEYIDVAIRQVYVAYLNSELVTFANDAEKNVAIALVTDTANSLADIQAMYPTVTIPDSRTDEDIIALLAEDMEIVNNAVAHCQDMVDEAAASYTLDEVIAAMRPLVDYTRMEMNGTPISDLGSNIETLLNSVIGGGGINISVPSGSGILSDIADFAGNYDADVTMEDVSYGGFGPMDITARMTTATSVNPVYLASCLNTLNSYNAGSGDESQTVIADYYGYALDLVFRTNVSDSDLQLQTAPKQRIYSDGDSDLTQGGGSYMQFRSSANISASKMLKLMSALRVVFIDKDQYVLSIAALDTTPGQDDYIVLENDDPKKAEGKYAKLNVADVQNSDYITQQAFEALPETSEVEIGSDGTIKAPLYLHSFSMTVSEKNSTADEIKYTGGLTLGEKLDSTAITALEESVAKQVTAIVYLDGSYVDNSMVAANGSQSMTGTLNLQFSSSVDLVPMENQGVRNLKDEEETPEQEPGDDLGEDDVVTPPVNEPTDEPTNEPANEPTDEPTGGEENTEDPEQTEGT